MPLEGIGGFDNNAQKPKCTFPKSAIQEYPEDFLKKSDTIKQNCKQQTSELNSEIEKSLEDYFSVDFSKINGEFKEHFGVSIIPTLQKYQEYIEQHLVSLSEIQKEKIKKSIGFKINGLSKKVSERIDFVDMQIKEGDYKSEERDLQIKNQRWIINSELQDILSFFSNKLFPIILYKQAGGHEAYLSQIETGDLKNKINTSFYIDELDELLNANVDEDGNFNERIFGLYSQELMDSTNPRHKEIFNRFGINQIEEVSILNEADQKIESDAMIKYIAFIALQCAPYAGSLVSIPTDIRDLFSNQEASMQYLIDLKLVNENFKMDKTWFDNAMGAIGLILTALGLQGIARGEKIIKSGKFLDKIGIGKLEDAMIKVGKNMGITEEKLNKAIYAIGNISGIPKFERLPYIENLDELLFHLKIDNFDPHNPDHTILLQIIEAGRKNPEILELVEVKKSIQLEISKNHPTISILAELSKGDIVQSKIFTGVKALNDTLGAPFTDKVLIAFKTEIQLKYPKFQSVWNDYKNFVLKLEAPNGIESSSINNILELAYQKTLKSDPDAQKILKEKGIENPMQVLSQSTRIKGETQSDIVYDLAQTRVNLEGELNGVTDDIGKVLQREEDIFSDYNKLTDNTHYINKSEKELPNGEIEKVTEVFHIKNGVLIRETTVDGGYAHRDTIKIFDNNSLSIEIITLVRKGKLPENSPLYKDVKKLLNGYVAHGEYIPPFWKIDDGTIAGKELLDTYKNIGKQSDINALHHLLTTTYKGGLSKAEFYNRVSGEGTLVFIDIEKMGSINMKNIARELRKYFKIAKKIDAEIKMMNDKLSKLSHVPSLHNKNSVDYIEYSQIQTKKQSLLLEKKEAHKNMLFESGGDMTKAFQRLVGALEQQGKTYENLDFYVGGDELMVYIKGKDVGIEFSRTMKQNLFDMDLSGRITHRYISEGTKKGENAIEELDKLTQYSKILEERFNGIAHMLQYRKDKGYFEKIYGQEWEDIYNLLIDKYHLLKKTTVFFQGDQKMIRFSKKLFPENNIFRLDEIINTDTNRLLEDSELIRILDESGVGRNNREQVI